MTVWSVGKHSIILMFIDSSLCSCTCEQFEYRTGAMCKCSLCRFEAGGERHVHQCVGHIPSNDNAMLGRCLSLLHCTNRLSCKLLGAALELTNWN